MIGLDRTKAPKYNEIKSLEIKRADRVFLDNGIPVYVINVGTQDVVKVDFIFKAGNWYEKKPLQALFTNQMLIEGSAKYSAKVIAEKIDFYGATLKPETDVDSAFVTVMSLNKYFSDVLEIVEDVIKNPAFPENEFRLIQAHKLQNFKVDSEKVKVLARRKFNEVVFGKGNPYAMIAVEDDFAKITLNEISTFHSGFYRADACKIIIAGKITGEMMDMLNEKFGRNKWGGKSRLIEPSYKVNVKPEKQYRIEKKDAVQTAIRIGRRLFPKNHPDYGGMSILSTILGGYFGSRLMSNIREDKGYTYGIGSVVAPYKNDGLFVVVTEVGSGVKEQALIEIYKEIARLRDELIPANELELVRNYMMGDILRSVDGPFALSDIVKDMIENNLDYSFYENIISLLYSINPRQLREFANKYLNEKDLVGVIAG